ncbi:MAG: DUF3373 family protein [Candidatus Electrothrix sp. AR4]|nr:DUF3373 family protein [Candidatus Electrothrix sp. AR4]
MIKTFSALTLAGMIALPTAVAAGGGKVPTDISDAQIEELARQVDALQEELAQKDEIVSENDEKMNAMGEELEDMESKLDDMNNMLEEKSAAWDLAARFKFFGDFRSRLDYFSATGADFLNPATGELTSGHEYSNDTLITNRFRLNMRVKATENLEFKGRLAMYKAWGMESYARNDLNTWWPQFDGNTTRTPSDNALRVDRAYVNWNNIADAPVWFSIGRRPTTDGVPAQIRLGTDERMATAAAYMDYSFDGAVLGYAYDWNNEELGSGRIRYCFGRGFENGVQWETATYHGTTNMFPLDDTEFTGFSWDVMQTEDRFLYIQSFLALNIFNRPNFQDDDMHDVLDEHLTNQTEGNIYHSAAVYQAKTNNFNYFIAGGWSRTSCGKIQQDEKVTLELQQPKGGLS